MIITAMFQFLYARLMLYMAEDPSFTPGKPKSGGRSSIQTWATCLIVLIVAFFLVIAILTLLGPAIGNVFANVIGATPQAD